MNTKEKEHKGEHEGERLTIFLFSLNLYLSFNSSSSHYTEDVPNPIQLLCSKGIQVDIRNTPINNYLHP